MGGTMRNDAGHPWLVWRVGVWLYGTVFCHLAAYDIIDLLEAYEGLELYLSFYEIYCGELYDLLNKRTKVMCREDAK